MSEIAVATTITVLIWAVGLVVFLVALRKHWFARFEHGFFFSLMAAITGIAILATSDRRLGLLRRQAQHR